MKRFENLFAVILGVLLIACLVIAYVTRNASPNPVLTKQIAVRSQTSPIDNRMLQTARQMASVADTAEEQGLAREALRLADHELDQAYATALREAAAHTEPASGPLKQLTVRIAELKARITADQRQIASFTKQAATDDTVGAQLELAKAQLALDQDELEDARQDLARQGGDPHAQLARALQEHDSAQHEAELPKVSMAGPPVTLSQQVQVWFSLGDRGRQLTAARQQAANKASTLDREHDTLEGLIKTNPPPNASAGPAAGSSQATSPSAGNEEEEDTAAMVARLRRLSDQRKTLTELDKRIQDSQQLAEIYKGWGALVETRRRSVLHQVVSSIAEILAVLLAALLVNRAMRRVLGRHADRRILQHLRVIAGIAVQGVAAVLILLIIFGPPSQTSTMIGLVTAGLTVVLKDFIVAFFGWFALMGRNGIRVGDWVEIEGVSGEVIEIGLLRTVLLEMGNWTSTGHPTGRRVAFVNSFALQGHYFNFSTAGQWLWDQLQVSLPAAGDPYQMSQEIRQTIERETDADATAAEQDWERVTRQYGIRPFSAKPAVDLRPSGTSFDVIVRYITRAPQRYEVKSRLFKAIVDILHKRAATSAR